MIDNSKNHLDGQHSGSGYLVSGKLTQEGGATIGALLVEAIDVRGKDEKVRLGSTAVDTAGNFNLPLPVAGDVASRSLDLQLSIYAPDQLGVSREQRLLFKSEIRENAAPREHFLIELSQKKLESAKVGKTKASTKNKEAVEARRKSVVKAEELSFEGKLRDVKVRRELFREKLKPALTKSLSNVTDEERKRGRFVEDVSKIPEISEQLVKKDVEILLGKQHSDVGKKLPATRTARWQLTKAQIEKLPGGGVTEATATEEEIEKILGLSLDKPASVAHRIIYDDPCRPKTEAEACLDGDDHHNNDDHDHEGTEGAGTENGEEGGGNSGSGAETGGTSAEAQLKFSSKNSIDQLMDEQASPEDRLVFWETDGNRNDQELEPVLTADKVGGALAKLTFAPGPAEVPALHYFNDLQVAFEPMWQEALDDRFLNDVEAAYDQFVDRGGAPAVNQITGYLNGIINAHSFLFELLDIGTAAETSYDDVTSFVIITREEWNALPKPARTFLKGVTDEMANLREELLDSINGGSDILDLLFNNFNTSSMMNAGFAPFLRPETIEIRAKLQLLKSDADGIVALARRLVLEVEATRPFRPTHTIIEELKAQHRKAYPFRHFAASPSHRSVNFGVLVTYKQIWTLKSYQVGELISAMPLAPDEERKYSRKTVRKTKRAVQEVESLFERRTGEIETKSRVESEIVNRATAKTNFSLSATGTVSYGAGGSGGGGGDTGGGGGGMGMSASATTTFTRDVEKHSSAVKKEFNEAIRKATEEIKNERKTEISTEENFEDEVTQSGLIKNPNNQITCTYLFYELQRRIGIQEKLHGLQSVVFVAMEVPAASELTYTWLIRHDWILSRVLLDPSYAPALSYVSTSLISDDVALREMREALFRQRKLVEELKQDLAERRVMSGLRYGALQKQIERTAKSSEGGGGFLGGVLGAVGDIAGGIPIVGGIVDGALDMFSDDGEVSQADQLREGASRDAYEREQREEQDLLSRVMSANSTLENMQNNYTDRLSRHLAQLGQVHRLIDHVWQNILYYMQAVWSHMPQDHLFLMLKDVPVPVFKKNKKRPITMSPIFDAVVDISAIDTNLVHATGGLGVDATPDPDPEVEKIKTQPLYQVANIYKPLGTWCNYLVFPMFEANPITELMMDPYVKLAEGEYGLSDPDPLGNITLEEFADYVCCLKRHYQEEDQMDVFEKRVPELREGLKKLLQASRREEDIVIPCDDGLYIEALPGTHSVMEQYKQLHRIIDVKSAQEDLRIKGLNSIRRAQMILDGDLSDPDIESVKNVFYHGAAPHDGDE